MRINLPHCLIGLLLCIVIAQCWAYGTLPFPVEPQAPTAPTVTHININAQPIFKSHHQVLPQAWVLHLMTPSNVALTKHLQQAGFNAYVVNGGKTKTIYIGPSISRQRLLQTQKRIKKQFKLSSTIEDYQVSWPTHKEY